MKTLKVPKIEVSENIQFDNIINILDEKGERHIIDTLNWAKEYPYKPLSSFTIAHNGKYILTNLSFSFILLPSLSQTAHNGTVPVLSDHGSPCTYISYLVSAR